jgi:hypothetical protein
MPQCRSRRFLPTKIGCPVAMILDRERKADFFDKFASPIFGIVPLFAAAFIGPTYGVVNGRPALSTKFHSIARPAKMVVSQSRLRVCTGTTSARVRCGVALRCASMRN